jgi:hypothetical protein
VRYGYRRVHVLLQRDGWVINVKRVYRLYRESSLQLRNKTPKRCVAVHKTNGVRMSIKKIGVAALAAVAIVGASLMPASARPMGGGFGGGGMHMGGGGFHGGGFHGGGYGGRGFGGRGFGIGAGLATGLAIGGLGYGYGYPAAYAYDDYGSDCWVQHRVVYRYGHRVIVPVRVCI